MEIWMDPHTWGIVFAFAAAAVAAIMPGIASSKAVGFAGETAAGVCAENPEVSSKMTILQLLPATQGIYGFLIAILILIKTGIIGGSPSEALNMSNGLQLLVGALPIALVGYFSAIKQGKTACAGMLLTGKRPEMSGKAIMMTSMVETYAILAFVISFIATFLGVNLG